MERLRVVQLISGLGVGGAERLVLQLASGLDVKRYEVRIVTLSQELQALGVYDASEAHVEAFDIRESLVRNCRLLTRSLQEFRPRIIHAHMFHAVIAAVAIRNFGSVESAICFTSHTAAHSPMRSTLIRALRGLRNADIIFQRDQHPHLNAKQCVVIPNGVTVVERTMRESWIAERRPLRFLVVGSLTEHKDPLGALRAFMRAALGDATLTFVGAGPLEGQLREAVNLLGASDRVQILGLRADVREIMRGADCLLVHSEREGMPLALLEAGAEGMAVVARPVGTIPNILGDDRGILASAEGFPDALRRIALDANGSVSMGARLRAHIVENYSLASTIRAHEQTYEWLAGTQ